MASVEENKLKKRNKILEAAYGLFAKNGINTTPIDEVVRCAGVAKGTFYLYFRDKYDLMDQIILYKSAAVVKSVVDQMKSINVDDKMSAIEQVTFFVDAIIDYMKDNKELLSVINEKSSILFTLILDDDNSKLGIDTEYFINILKKLGIPEEKGRKNIFLISSMIFSVCTSAILSENPFTIEEIRPDIHLIVNKILS